MLHPMGRPKGQGTIVRRLEAKRAAGGVVNTGADYRIGERAPEVLMGPDGHVVGVVGARHRPWQRTGSSFLDGEPPHFAPGSQHLDIIWGDAQRTIPLAATDRDGCLAVFMSGLDAAWAEAEAALPEGWVLQGITPSRAEWEALASSWTARAGDKQDWQAGAGPTPAAALRALAAKLREAHQ